MGCQKLDGGAKTCEGCLMPRRERRRECVHVHEGTHKRIRHPYAGSMKPKRRIEAAPYAAISPQDAASDLSAAVEGNDDQVA